MPLGGAFIVPAKVTSGTGLGTYRIRLPANNPSGNLTFPLKHHKGPKTTRLLELPNQKPLTFIPTDLGFWVVMKPNLVLATVWAAKHVHISATVLSLDLEDLYLP